MENRSVLQWDKDDCAAAGLVKFDLLGLGMLTMLHLAVDLIREHGGVEVDLATIPQDDDGRGGGVNPSLRLGLRDTLDAVCTTFKFELAIDVFALYSSDHLFEAPGFRRAGIHHFHPPALGVSIPTIHPKQVCRKERCLIPAGASPDLHNDSTLVLGIPWEQ